MNEKRLVKASKYLARHLRHEPERLGLTLEPGGWVRVDALLAACRSHSFALTRRELIEVVERNDKRRFSLDASGSRIRANHGHSIDLDLDLVQDVPPVILFHGTSHAAIGSVMASGIDKMGRRHVHLSRDLDSARKVGRRHGRPVVFEVEAGRMHDDGFAFFQSSSGIWLTETVPPSYLGLRPSYLD